MDAQSSFIIGALGGATIGFVSSVITTFIIKYFEEKKDFRRLVLETALRNWEKTTDLTEKLRKDTGRPATFLPLEAFLIGQADIIEAVSKKGISENEVKELLNHQDKLYNIVYELLEDKQNKKMKS